MDYDKNHNMVEEKIPLRTFLFLVFRHLFTPFSSFEGFSNNDEFYNFTETLFVVWRITAKMIKITNKMQAIATLIGNTSSELNHPIAGKSIAIRNKVSFIIFKKITIIIAISPMFTSYE